MVSLRQTLARWLRALATWVDVPVGLPAAAPNLEPVVILARTLVQEQETRWPDRSGEAKRHQVYAQLLDAFPETPKRALSRAIEDAL